MELNILFLRNGEMTENLDDILVSVVCHRGRLFLCAQYRTVLPRPHWESSTGKVA